MRIYNSILSDLEVSIEAMEASIDPFNILNVILITPDDGFLNTVRYIDSDILERYTKDMDVNKAERLFNNSIKYTLWDYDLRIKCLRFIWFLCNKIVLELYTYWNNSNRNGMSIAFNELCNNDNMNVIKVHPYRLDGADNSNKGQYALTLMDVTASSALILYTNNLRKND